MAREHSPRPPRLAERLVRARLPRPLREPILGDLAEEHAERVGRRGPFLAGLWYWGQLLLLRPGRLRREARRLDGRWDPPGGRDLVPGSLPSFGDLPQMIRYAFRRLLATPGFTLVAIVSLALGIGANTAIFSLVNTFFFFDKGVGNPETLVDVYQDYRGRPYWSLSLNHWREIDETLDDVFEETTAYVTFEGRIEGTATRERVFGEMVTGDYFGTLGVPMHLGRAFSEEEVQVGAEIPVVVLDHDYWRRAFLGDRGVVGSTVRLNARDYTVVGVAPEGFQGKALPLIGGDVYAPYGMNDHLRDNGASSTNMNMSARLAPGVTEAEARARLDALAATMAARGTEGDGFEGWAMYGQDDFALAPALDGVAAQMALLLSAVVAMVLLIACTNLASFLLARAADRRREFAVRMALGAGRTRILLQLLTESVMLGLVGGLAGLAVAWGAIELLLSVPPPALPIPLDLDVPLDGRVLAFTLGVSVLAGLLFGLAPALQAARSEVAATLRDESAGGGGRRKVGLRGMLVVAQVAVSLVLLTGAGLFVRSLMAATRVDPGFEASPVAVVTVDPDASGYAPEEAAALHDELLRRVRALPEVEQAGLGTRLPLELGNWNNGIRPTGWEPDRWWYSELAYITPGYLETLGIEVLQGRDFTEEDRASTDVVIVNQAAAGRLWPEGGAVGQTAWVQGRDEPVRVVGVVETTKVKTLGEAPTSYLFYPLPETSVAKVWLTARSRRPALGLSETLRATARDVDPGLFVADPGTAAQTVGLQLFLPRMGAGLLAVMGGLALLLAVIGLYGVVSYAVARREREMGIRLSLGAEPGAVVRLMMGSGFRLVAVGGVLGLAVAVVAGQLVERFLFGIQGVDLVTFVAVPLVLVGAGALAAWLPARRAARVNPSDALRSE